MKKIIIFLTSIFILLSMSACSDFLDSDNLVKKDGSNYPTSNEEANQLLTGAYAIMVQMNNGHPFLLANILSDDCFGGGGSNDILPQAIGYLKSSSENDLSPIWIKYYAGIYRVNNLLASEDLIVWKSEAEKNNILGQAYFLRAFYYYQMATLFGTVPIVTTPIPQNNPKASPEELFILILGDLKNAINLLPTTIQQPEDLGRASRWASEALMARAYLFYDGYYNQNARKSVTLNDGSSITSDNIISWLEDCINNSGHKLVDDFRNQWPYSLNIPESTYKYAKDNNLSWLGEEGDNKETIFAIKYTSTSDWSSPNSPLMCSQIPLYIGLRGQSQPSFGAGWGMSTVNTNLWNNWDDNDLRKKGSIINVNDSDEGMDDFQWGGWEAWQETGYFIKKYFPFNVTKKDEAGNETWINYSCIIYGRSPNYQLDPTQDLVLIRFADVLLMHSELTKSVDGINKVRQRAALNTITSYSDDALRNERRYELAFEALRYYDLLRWYGKEAGTVLKANINNSTIYNNKVKTTINENRGKGYFDMLDQRVKETGGFLQIPNSEIQLSNGVLEQNPGWEGSSNIF